MTRADRFLRTLKENEVRLVSYVPDNVLTPLIAGAAADNYFMSVGATREDEAVGTLAGAYMGGLRGVAMMQTSGFALIANALASLIVPYQIPAITQSHWVRDQAHFEQLIGRRFDDGGPVLLAAKIDDQSGTAQTPRDPALIRQCFMQGLGTGRKSALDE
jgi:hypothetical protein